MRTNAGGAEDFKLMWSPVSAPTGPWQPWVPHRPGRTITELHPRAGTFRLARASRGQSCTSCLSRRTAFRASRRHFTEAAYLLAVQRPTIGRCAVDHDRIPAPAPPRWIKLRSRDRALDASRIRRTSMHQISAERLHARAADGAHGPGHSASCRRHSPRRVGATPADRLRRLRLQLRDQVIRRPCWRWSTAAGSGP